MTLDANFFVSLFNIDMLDVYRKGGGEMTSYHAK